MCTTYFVWRLERCVKETDISRSLQRYGTVTKCVINHAYNVTRTLVLAASFLMYDVNIVIVVT